MSAEVLLRYRAASVGYAARTIVADAELEVAAGEIVGLVGPNGAGKSTLLRAATDDADLLAGSIEIAGRPITDMTPRERAALVGVVPQQVSAAFSIPAEEFVEMGRHPHLPRFGRPVERDLEAVARALEVTDTARLAGQAVDQLSGGDLQRLAFAQALATEPRVLLLDEPTSHLDLNHQLQVLDLTRELADSGLAVLAVFHDLELAARYADRVAVVASGALGTAQSPEAVITAEMLRTVFGVRAVVATDPVTGTVAVTPVLRDQAVESQRRGRVLVVGGSGAAAPLLRRLVLGGWDVVGAALNSGDADAIIATALGVEFASIPPFAPMDAQAAVQVAKLAASVDAIVVCDVPFGHGNIDNLLVAVRAGKPLVLVGDIAERDFTGGAADSYWAEAIGAGALRVDDLEAAERALGEAIAR